jgi:hypothetical protein
VSRHRHGRPCRPVLTAVPLESRSALSYLFVHMTAAPRPHRLFRIALACVAAVCVLLAGASMADRLLPSLPPSVHATGSSRVLREATARALAVHHGAPINHASTRPATTKHPAWQRSGGRRPHRTASSQISTFERTPGTVGGPAGSERRGLSATSRLAVFQGDRRLSYAPTRAPPTHR